MKILSQLKLDAAVFFKLVRIILMYHVIVIVINKTLSYSFSLLSLQVVETETFTVCKEILPSKRLSAEEISTKKFWPCAPDGYIPNSEVRKFTRCINLPRKHPVKPWKPRTSLKKTKIKVDEEIEDGKIFRSLSMRCLLEVYLGPSQRSMMELSVKILKTVKYSLILQKVLS